MNPELEDSGEEVTQRVLIIGSGSTACLAAAELADQGISVILAEKSGALLVEALIPQSQHGTRTATLPDRIRSDHAHIEILLDTEIASCNGAVGHFIVSLNRAGTTRREEIGAVIIAEKGIREPNFELYAFRPSSAVLSFSEFQNRLPVLESSIREIAFIAGMEGMADVRTMAEVMRCALHLRARKSAKVYVLGRDVKVAGAGMEALYQESRRSGVLFFRFSYTRPIMRRQADGSVSISLIDETSSEPVELEPDIIVVDEVIRPSNYQRRLAEIFRLDTDHAGFLQSDNGHRYGAFSNRSGVIIAGASRNAPSRDEMTDACTVALAAAKCLHPDKGPPQNKPMVNPGLCATCLTCYRVCPHGAIAWKKKALIMSAACQGCGICAAECPMQAIEMPGFSDGRSSGRAVASESGMTSASTGTPRIVAFCCRHSAVPAMQLASRMGPLPEGLRVIEVPCAGSIGVLQLMKEFEAGADAVMVIACHHGNCSAERGNSLARQRLEKVGLLLKEMGLPWERLMFRTIAANMGRRFCEIMDEAVKMIEKPGPNTL